MNTLAHISDLVRAAVEREFPGQNVPIAQRSQDERFGDYQSNAAMPLAKALGQPPRAVAEKLMEAVAWQGVTEQPQIAGPGFINFRLTPAFLGAQVAAIAADPVHAGVATVANPQTVVLDFSSPNVAKRLHVGHIRSTILGSAMYKVLKFLGHHPIGDNHVGDWGTQFGLLIVAHRRWGVDPDLDPIEGLEALYKKASALAKEDPELADEARAELAKLQQGDPANRALWKEFVDVSRQDVDSLYAMLDVTFDHWHGESFYEPYLAEIVERLERTGLAVEDQGALVIFFGEDETPFIIRKKDGAYLYSTTDIATLEYRLREFHPERILYFVDRRQALHFKQLFDVAGRMGIKDVELEHIGFGSIMGKDGKPLKTRDGETPSLRALLQEGIDSAYRLVKENRPELPEEKLASIARAVGIGAIKYADLSQNRNTDYKFDLEKMIAFDGNTGPYLQYTHARICSIFRKLEGPWTVPATVELVHEDEISLARALVRYEETLVKVAESCMPNYLADHLFTLARAYSAFYTNCPVLKSEGATRDNRLALCLAVRHQLATGLTTLGIEPLEEM
ncbi:MAG: args: arginine--trna ligase [Cyanobacteria bacterium RYN_339]|nr:args: arginine--trna ligase [Cyanobacteria bacterium RYN_339]